MTEKHHGVEVGPHPPSPLGTDVRRPRSVSVGRVVSVGLRPIRGARVPPRRLHSGLKLRTRSLCLVQIWGRDGEDRH